MSDEMKLNQNEPAETDNMDTETSSEDLDVTDQSDEKKDTPEIPPTEKIQSELNDYKDQLVRMIAEFENYKKRTQKEFSQVIQQANEKLITELLPVIDDMERTMKSAPETEGSDTKSQTFIKAVEMISKKLNQILSRQGLKPVESVGKEFNVDLHDALMQVEAPDKISNTIVEEYEKGYLLNDKVIRHAKVIVAK